MSFAQLTYRDSLADIEVCLRSRPDQLYHMGFRSRIAIARWPRPMARETGVSITIWRKG